jgi:hypothetical protein
MQEKFFSWVCLESELELVISPGDLRLEFHARPRGDSLRGIHQALM